MKLHRIASGGRTWVPADVSGAGAASEPGRWNNKGEHVLYAAPALSLAVLETAAHIDDSGLPLNRFVVELDVPDAVWDARLTMRAGDLPGGWDAIPYCMVSTTIGGQWYQEGRHALLELPSVIVPEEPIVLVNATHADARQIRAKAGRRFDYNTLFRRPW